MRCITEQKGKEMGKQIECRYCRKPFESVNGKLFCRPECKAIYQNRKSEGRLDKPIYGVCMYCGQWYADFKNPPSKFCGSYCESAPHCDWCGRAYIPNGYENQWGKFCGPLCLNQYSWSHVVRRLRKLLPEKDEGAQKIRVSSNSFYYK